jgi:ABC-type antimicrobial peptide transport system permease subunit
VAARTRQDPLAVVDAIRSAARVDADQAVYGARSMNQMLDSWLAARRFLMVLLSTFATLALALACAGTYGVLAYAVGQRTRELGIRMALGASPASVLGWILGYGGRRRAVRRSSEFTAAMLLLIVVAAGACYLPARRALRTDPLIALRL